ncbi:uncharacterized protein [Spinacia oleracea]|uniref:Uncharacterized protein isoform X2 n=1 Tax=Spinacia oleracea TaxID=3562 RepID=A0A9R0KBG5_SPIOL|nr:uncharacterized protein LOC110804245 isoform X2 [Spinacia oleracea]
METRSSRGCRYELRSKVSSNAKNLRSQVKSSRSRKKHKLINGAEGENKAKGNKKGLSNSSGMDSKDLTALKQHVARKRLFANLALKFYKKKTGQNLELVDPGYKGQGFLKEGLVRHINFEAKNKDDPNASELQFFAELTTTRISNHRVDLCISLGPTVKLPEYADTRGCCICYPGVIYHPATARFKGRD